ncbi:mediator of RNA polymerase II transcription subunit 27 [Senna tora]|uniref:Mediator of RNA polymerase II transcription subunit 27 n=1 Tax=Senna tora TaxID=362788 RepID=A0A834TCN2_9FABA|nr:mediator of RNA polymerase II transcription subunit 27 [Senna tora]
MQHSQPATAAVVPTSTPPPSGSPTEEAPPKQVALAMDRLGQAARIIADIRIGADRLLEALFIAAQPHQSTKPLQLFVKEDASMRQHLQDLRSLGRQLEESGVLNESLRSRSNSWGLHMPLVCPDGAVVAYAWKRQLAGQAGASAVDRTRLALKAFTDQKRRFFPHLDDGLQNNEPDSKKHCGSEEITMDYKDEISNLRTLPNVLMRLKKEVPNLEILTFERLDWLKRASSLSSSTNENSLEHNFHAFFSPDECRYHHTTIIAYMGKIQLSSMEVSSSIIYLAPSGYSLPDPVYKFSFSKILSTITSKDQISDITQAYHSIACSAKLYSLSCECKSYLAWMFIWYAGSQDVFCYITDSCSRELTVVEILTLLNSSLHRNWIKFVSNRCTHDSERGLHFIRNTETS